MNQKIYAKEDTIFVQIASYRDSELKHTLHDIFEKAKRPENIFIGICHQYDMKGKSDEYLFVNPFPRTSQLRIEEIDYREARGACFARNIVQKLWKNEKWSLVIDSHMRFENGWDEIAVLIAKDLIDEGYNPVLTTHVGGYNLGEELVGCTPNSRAFFNPNKLARIHGGWNMNFEKPLHNALFSGGFSFALAKAISDVEYDPFIFFLGEEITMATRFWTSGYDLFFPHKVIAYHLYNPIGVGQQDRKLVWEDNPTLNEKDIISRNRALHITQALITRDFNVLKDISKYSLGSVRTIRDYERFSGIDFRKGKMREHAKEGIFEQWQEVVKTETLRPVFANKLPEDQTKISQYLVAIKEKLSDINSILEIQCGSAYDIENCRVRNDKNITYTGINLLDEVIRQNRRYFRDDKNKIFITLDASNETLPKSDLVICVGLSQYLPISNIWSLLENIRDSEAKYFAFDYCNSDDEKTNLSFAPFYFPEPELIILDSDSNRVAIYEISKISFFMDWHSQEISKLRRCIFDNLEKDLKDLWLSFSKQGYQEFYKETLLDLITLSYSDYISKYHQNDFRRKILEDTKTQNIINNLCRAIYKRDWEILSQQYNVRPREITMFHISLIAKDYIRWNFNLSLFL